MKENSSRRALLQVIEGLPALADLLSKTDGHFDYELDLEVCVYGRSYQGKRVGPYIRLLTFDPGETIIRQGDWGGNTFYIGVDQPLDVFIATPAQAETKVVEIPAGRQFGELSVLAGVPRAATVKAPESAPAQVVEIQRPALRLLRKLGRFRESLDHSYLHHGRLAAVQKLHITPSLGEELLAAAEDLSQFRVLSKNHVLFREGDPVQQIYVLKEGWLRRQRNGGQTDYLGEGHAFGLDRAAWDYTAVLMGRAEVLTIHLDGLRNGLRDRITKELRAFAAPPLTQPAEPRLKTQDRLISTGLVDATNLLLMDMDLCVRCGRCSMACHQIHGHSRLIRRGIAVVRPERPLLAPMACLHCQDPECLTGCPTGAIGRLASGEIDINAKSCIGCGDCAVNCPYNAISMTVREKPAPAVAAAPPLPLRARVETRVRELVTIQPAPLPPPADAAGDLLAVKCNLCSGTTMNPATATTAAYGCEDACPTGALIRIPPRQYFPELAEIQGAAYQTPAPARLNIHRNDPPARAIHAAGLLATLILTVAAVAALTRFGYKGTLLGFLDLRWITGIAGLLAIAAAMSYVRRRQIFRVRAGALRYWMWGHIYLGLFGSALILLHGGARSGGLLTTALALTFDLVLLSGLWGLLCYRLGPRALSSLEAGSHLLADDLDLRRTQLEQEIAAAVAAHTELKSGILRRLRSASFLLRQFTHREPLQLLVSRCRAELAPQPGPLRDAVDALVALRRVEAQQLLHTALRSWLPLHVIAASLMLSLLAVHLFQVFYAR